MIKSNTARGFRVLQFKDRYNVLCYIQKSSLATEDAIWFGVNDADPKILATDARKLGIPTTQSVGWIPYPIPTEVLLKTQMHLTREQVAELLPILQHFVDTGELP
jgi:hypothetical protein